MRTTNLKHLTLCADDFGIAPGVNNAIIDLVENGRINAVSCMTSMPFWKNGAQSLKQVSKGIEVGLHITLTDQRSIASVAKLAPNKKLPSLPTLLRLIVTNSIKEQDILAEIQRQYDSFINEMGHPPDFIDGHHHVHQLPKIRSAVIQLINTTTNTNIKKPWLRVTWESPKKIILRKVSIWRAFSIGFCGFGLKYQAKINNIPSNKGFVGVYDFKSRKLNAQLMTKFLTHASGGTLMFCHPGLVDKDLICADKLTHARETEYKFFRSIDFMNTLKKSGFTLSLLP